MIPLDELQSYADWRRDENLRRDEACAKYYGTMPFRDLWTLNGSWPTEGFYKDTPFQHQYEYFRDALIDYDMDYPGHIKNHQDFERIEAYFREQDWLTTTTGEYPKDVFSYPQPNE